MMAQPTDKHPMAGRCENKAVENFDVIDHDAEVLSGIKVTLWHSHEYDDNGNLDDEYYDVTFGPVDGSMNDHLRPELLDELIAGLEKMRYQWNRRVIASQPILRDCDAIREAAEYREDLQ